MKQPFSIFIVDEWCEGYQRGVELTREHWNGGGEDIAVLLAPIYAFTAVTNWRGHDFNDDEVKKIQQAITPKAREIHARGAQNRRLSLSL